MTDSNTMDSFAGRYVAPPDVALGSGCLAQCGPECRFARELPGYDSYVWCTRYGAPRSTSSHSSECSWFTPRTAQAPAISRER